VAVNYASENYELKIPSNANLLIGSKTLPSGGVTVWKEK
jgi:beta-galactosidase